MAVSRALRRLLRIRQLEEEQSRLALESGLGDVHRLRNAQAANVERNRRGRGLIYLSAGSGEFRDRLEGLEETRAAESLALVLPPRISEAEQEAASLREDYLLRRVERRQAETLIEEAEARDALDRDRRSQQGLDDWFRNRRLRADAAAGSDRRGHAAGATRPTGSETESDGNGET